MTPNVPGNRHRPTLALGIVGCGAITEVFHLPTAAAVAEAVVVALADLDIERARALGRAYGVNRCVEDYRALFDGVDAVVLALPNHLHASAAMEFLRRDIAVLVEKPPATSLDEARAMSAVASASQTLLQVGLSLRFCAGARIVKQAIDLGWLGRIQNFCLEFGSPFAWPVTSGSLFIRDQAVGGVLLDAGSHMLDCLLWWLGEATEVDYRDDSLGGVEAECGLTLHLSGPRGAVGGTVALSRLRRLRNIARIVGDRMTVEFDLTTPDRVLLSPTAPHEASPSGFTLDTAATGRQSWTDVYAAQLRAFTRAVLDGASSPVPAESAMPVVGLIERCYQHRGRLELPWLAADPAQT